MRLRAGALEKASDSEWEEFLYWITGFSCKDFCEVKNKIKG